MVFVANIYNSIVIVIRDNTNLWADTYVVKFVMQLFDGIFDTQHIVSGSDMIFLFLTVRQSPEVQRQKHWKISDSKCKYW